jgi:hypothetical protein
MHDDKEKDAKKVSEDWWHQYLSDDEKRRMQPAEEELDAGEFDVAEVQAEPEPEWKVYLERVQVYLQAHGRKLAIGGLCLVALVHWVCVNVQLHQLDSKHADLQNAWGESQQELAKEREEHAKQIAAAEATLQEGRERAAAQRLQNEQQEAEYLRMSEAFAAMQKQVSQFVVLSQELYRMKVRRQHAPLMELESDAESDSAIRALWKDLSESLKKVRELEGEAEKVEVSLLEARVLTGEVELAELEGLAWADGEANQNQLWWLAQLYFKQAQMRVQRGDRGAAEEWLQELQGLVGRLDLVQYESAYLKARVSELQAQMQWREQPSLAYEASLAVVESLRGLIRVFPENAALRMRLLRVCDSLCLVPPRAGGKQSIALVREEARRQIDWLHP